LCLDAGAHDVGLSSWSGPRWRRNVRTSSARFPARAPYQFRVADEPGECPQPRAVARQY
jgi:hypothetical protein